MSRVALLVTGASGMLLPIHVLRALAKLSDIESLHLVVSRGAGKVLRHELAEVETGGAGSGAAARLVAAAGIKGDLDGRLRLHTNEELDAEIASGSYRLGATLIVPCSSGTLGALASGTATNLIHRGGLVALKERWPLILGFRETPFNLVHVENMRRLIYAGATLLPPIPAFYVGGEDLGRFLDAYVLRLLDAAGLSAVGGEELRWQGGRSDD